MSLTSYLYSLLLSVISYLSRAGAKIVLRVSWHAVCDDSLRMAPASGAIGPFSRIEVEARISCFHDMIEKMRFYRITFRELGIDPLAFWEKLKRLSWKVRDEISAAFRANYAGRKILEHYMRTLGETLSLVHEQVVRATVVIRG